MVGRKIVSYRADTTLNQTELAQKLNEKFPESNWTRGKYQRIESGKYKVSFDDVIELCLYFDISNPFDVQWYF